MRPFTFFYLAFLLFFIITGCKNDTGNKITIVDKDDQELNESNLSTKKTQIIDPSSLNVRRGVKTIKEAWFKAKIEDNQKYKITGEAMYMNGLLHIDHFTFLNNVSPTSFGMSPETQSHYRENGKIDAIEMMQDGEIRGKIVFNYSGDDFKIFMQDENGDLKLLTEANIDENTGLPTYTNGPSLNPDKQHLYGNEVIEYENFGDYILSTATSRKGKILYKTKFIIENDRIVTKTHEDIDVILSSYEEDYRDENSNSTMTTNYEYNKEGLIKKLSFGGANIDLDYEYNKKGDWVKCRVIIESPEGKSVFVATRVYEYY